MASALCDVRRPEDPYEFLGDYIKAYKGPGRTESSV